MVKTIPEHGSIRLPAAALAAVFCAVQLAWAVDRQDTSAAPLAGILEGSPPSPGQFSPSPDPPSRHLEHLDEIVEALHRRGLLAEDGETLEKRVLQALLGGLSPRVGALPSGEIPDMSPAESLIAGPWQLRGDTTYLRVDAIGADFAEKLGERLAVPPGGGTGGIVIDLRRSEGYADNALLIKLHSLVGRQTRPCAILVGPDTRQGAECLAALHAARPRCVTVGGETAGTPYRPVEMKISDKLTVLVPLRPPAEINLSWPPESVKPDLPVAAAERDNLPETELLLPKAIENDPVLRKASDMMTMVIALGGRTE